MKPAPILAAASLLLAAATLSAQIVIQPREPDIKGFHKAVAEGNLRSVTAMLEDEPTLVSAILPAESEANRLTPIHTAVANGQLKIVELLLKKGAGADEVSYGTTPLTRATYTGRNDIIELLLDNGADINARTDAADLAQVTPIRSAQIHGKLDTAQLLLEKGARIDVYSAAGLGWKTFVRDSLKKDPALATAKDRWGTTPIGNAIAAGQAATTQQLIDAGADPHAVHPEMKYNALHIAAERGYRDLALVLLKACVDMNARDINNRTPLTWARVNKQEKLITLLREENASE